MCSRLLWVPGAVEGGKDGATAVRHFHARNVRKVQHAMRANKTQNMPIAPTLRSISPQLLPSQPIASHVAESRALGA